LHLSSSYVGFKLGFKFIDNEAFVEAPMGSSVFGLLSETIKYLSTLDLGKYENQT
jgi:hypothetical protein